MHRAGGIHQPASRLEQRPEAIQQLALQHHQPIDRGGVEPPAGIGVAGQGAEAGAGGIQQDAVELAQQLRLAFREGGGIATGGANAVEAQPLGIAIHPPQAGFGAIERHHLPLVVDQLRQVGALAAGGGAGVEDALTGLGIQQRRDALGGAVLHAPMALVVAGQLAQIAAAAPQREG